MKKALADLNRALELDPEDLRAYLDRAAVHHISRITTKRPWIWNRAIELDPMYSASCSMMGVFLANTGKPQEALKYFDKAAQLGDAGAVRYAEMIKDALTHPPAE